MELFFSFVWVLGHEVWRMMEQHRLGDSYFSFLLSLAEGLTVLEYKGELEE